MDENGKSHTYQVVDDRAIVKAAGKSYLRKYLGVHFEHALKHGLSFVPLGFLAFVIGWTYADQEVFGFGLTITLLSMILFGLIYYGYAVMLASAAGRKHDEGQVWTCEVTDKYWSFERSDGYKQTIPWELMQLDFEHPDMWYVKYYNQSVGVFRKPLRDAGLENEFLQRMNAVDE